MMLVSLSSLCQYPTVKTIGKDTVVLMTLKQANDINQTFSNLKDSLVLAEKKSKMMSDTIFILSNDKNKLINNLSITEKHIETKNIELDILQSKLKSQEKLYSSEKIKWAGWMFFSFMVTVLVGALK